ncbi:acid protease [Pterulicium gracile]|uniref:Acid protease n=1 Tax=Pterulicium gracile TaxID=1884261 RepID=A0A5C3QNZ0_9AGAR|nr:acid protease [Pterula gracilis]
MSKTFVFLLALASLAVTTPVAPEDIQATVPIVSTFNFIDGKDLIQRDRARIHQLRSVGQQKKSAGGQNTPAYNQAVVHSALVGVGSPPTPYSLIIDTGSSNTWVGAEKAYNRTRTSKPTGSKVGVSYGSGSFDGDQFLDLVTISYKLTIPDQSIGVANKSKGFNGFDGILGIGPVGLTRGTLQPNRSEFVPTVTDNLFKSKKINYNSVAVSFVPTIGLDEEGQASGELTWGGVDYTKVEGKITYTPITRTFPADRYWGIDQKLTYGKSVPIMQSSAGIVDTGTTLTYIASDAFARYKNATGSEYDEDTGLLAIPCAKFGSLNNLHFYINGQKFELSPDAQAWPRIFNEAIGGTNDKVYLVIADIGDVTGTGLDFINGMGFLQRFYTVYDTQKRRVGISRTPHTFRKVNVPGGRC